MKKSPTATSKIPKSSAGDDEVYFGPNGPEKLSSGTSNNQYPDPSMNRIERDISNTSQTLINEATSKHYTAGRTVKNKDGVEKMITYVHASGAKTLDEVTLVFDGGGTGSLGEWELVDED